MRAIKQKKDGSNLITGSRDNCKISPQVLYNSMKFFKGGLAPNHQVIFQILSLDDDITDDNENESLETLLLDISKKLISGRATGKKDYPEELLRSIKLNVILLDDILDLLVNYYNRTYKEYKNMILADYRKVKVGIVEEKVKNEIIPKSNTTTLSYHNKEIVNENKNMKDNAKDKSF
ncbi:hypothetical protein C1646_761780 [Rhizophagus diaphanus]|nr:hypothetical protein C1646_761780 [Rhizophagus diaphanus] [Rhizophagus sp. MUCL 43196]